MTNLSEQLVNHKLWIRSRGKEGVRADFSECNLEGINLAGANLRGANLVGANLTNGDFTKTNFMNADLTGAIFAHSNLAGADFFQANLSLANFFQANLSNSNFNFVNLSEADLTGADITNAVISFMCLSGWEWRDFSDPSSLSLSKATFFGANFRKATIIYTEYSKERPGEVFLCKYSYNKGRFHNLIGSLIKDEGENELFGLIKLESTEKEETEIVRARANDGNSLVRSLNERHGNRQRPLYSNANLTKANFSGANLQGANFWRTNLSGVNLREANLRGSYFC